MFLHLTVRPIPHHLFTCTVILFVSHLHLACGGLVVAGALGSSGKSGSRQCTKVICMTRRHMSKPEQDEHLMWVYETNACPKESR